MSVTITSNSYSAKMQTGSTTAGGDLTITYTPPLQHWYGDNSNNI